MKTRTRPMMKTEPIYQPYMTFGDEPLPYRIILNYEDITDIFDVKFPFEDQIWSDYDTDTYSYAHNQAIEEGKSEDEAEQAGQEAEEKAESEYFNRWLGHVLQRIDEMCEYVDINFITVERTSEQGYKYNEYALESENWKETFRRIYAVRVEHDPKDVTDENIEWDVGEDADYQKESYKNLKYINSSSVPKISTNYRGRKVVSDYGGKTVADYVSSMMDR